MKLFNDHMGLKYDAATNGFTAISVYEWKPWWKLSASYAIPEFKFTVDEVTGYDLRFETYKGTNKPRRERLIIATQRGAIWIYLAPGQSSDFLGAVAKSGKINATVSTVSQQKKIIATIVSVIGIPILIFGGWLVFDELSSVGWDILKVKSWRPFLILLIGASWTFIGLIYSRSLANKSLKPT